MKKAFKALVLTGGILCVVKGLDNRLEMVHYDIFSPEIPKGFDGFKILQISDYHCDAVPGIIGEVHCEMPDIIVSTGDLADDDGSFNPAVRLCEQLLKIAPVYAVNGNHDVWRADYSRFEAALTRIGVRTLHNERTELMRGSDKIGLCGIDDPLTNDETKLKKAVKNSLSSLPQYDGYDILLFHRANMFDLIKNAALTLFSQGICTADRYACPTAEAL